MSRSSSPPDGVTPRLGDLEQVVAERVLDEVEGQAVDAEMHALIGNLIPDLGAIEAAG